MRLRWLLPASVFVASSTLGVLAGTTHLTDDQSRTAAKVLACVVFATALALVLFSSPTSASFAILVPLYLFLLATAGWLVGETEAQFPNAELVVGLSVAVQIVAVSHAALC